MKILKTDDWEFLGIESENDQRSGGFLFLNKKYGDYVIVKAAKYIIKRLNIVLFLTFSAGMPNVNYSYNDSSEFSQSTISRLELLPEASAEDKVTILQSLADEESGGEMTGTEANRFG